MRLAVVTVAALCLGACHSMAVNPTLRQGLLQRPSDPSQDTASADGAANPDENDGRGTNPMKQVPVAGQAFEVTPVSTSMKCVINLTLQYMIVYTALAICRTAADSFGVDYTKLPVQNILQTAALTVNYAPMLAVLFLGCRMRVLWLTHGKGNPPEWVQMCMHMCTYAVLLMTLCVCIIPVFTGEVLNVDVKTGDIKADCEPFTNKIAAYCFTALKYLIMIFLYVGVLCVIYGIITFEPPKGLWPQGVPPVSPAVACVCSLSCQYFIVYAAMQFARTFSQFTSGTHLSRFEQVMLKATMTMNFAPMLAVLFLAARMRALQMDPINGAPQPWAQNWFYYITYAVLAQTILAIAVPLVLQGEAIEGKSEGDMSYKVQNEMLGMVLTACRWIIMLSIYIGFSVVIYSILTIEHPKNPALTPPISVTMQCVINLTVQFFFIYFMVWLFNTLEEFTWAPWTLLHNTMVSARDTVQFCPMLAILFVGARMRALQLTRNRGAPQGWVQDGMYMATWAVLIQFLMCLLTPLVTGEPTKLDKDGNVIWAPDHPWMFAAVQTVRWIGFIFLYGGVITVIVGVFMMTPETCNGRGSVPLVGDGKVPGTDVGLGVPGTEIGYKGVEEPPGVNDVPGAPR